MSAIFGIAFLTFCAIAIIWILYKMVFESIGEAENKKMKKIAITLTIIISIIGVAGEILYISSASFQRDLKDISSNYGGGITREVIVYSEGGEVIYKQRGKFDIEFSDQRLKWIDEKGNVQLVYLGNSATTVVNEIKE